MSENEKRSLLGKAVHAGERVIGVGASRTAEGPGFTRSGRAMTEARRLAKRGRYAAEDLVDEASYRIKRDPLRSVAITLAVGLGVGALAGWLAGRSARS